jgi:beta-lactamase regulating signal transducer with metallopeptidase domain
MPGFQADSILLLGVKVSAGVFIKASIVVLLAWAGTLMTRRESASVRYAIWSAALVTLVVVPFLSTVMPPLEVTQVKPSGTEAKAVATLEGGGRTSAPERAAGSSERSGSSAAQSPGRDLARSLRPAAVILLGIWLAGASAFLFRLVMHGIRVRGILNRAEICSDGEINGIVENVFSDLKLRRGVRTFLSNEVSMPFSCGVLRPLIVLPGSAADWPGARKRNILLHELAHVARWDYVIHIAAGLICAVYWINPLVWFAAKRNAMERERACDDLVIERIPSTVYAEELLHIARSQVERMVPVRAVAMAAKEDLTERIRGVMSSGVSRNPVHWTGVFLICAFTLALTLPLAGVELLGIEARAAKALGIPSTSSLMEELRTGDDADARRRAAWWLGEHEAGKAVSTLTRYGLRDEDPEVRLVSAWALGEIKDRGSIDALADALNDDDFFVREMAVLALGEIESPSALEYLVEAFDSEEGLQGAVIWALGEIHGDKAERARMAAFEVIDERPWPNEEVWTGTLGERGAFKWLRKRGSSARREDVIEMIEQLRSSDPDDRLDAAFQLGRFGIGDSIETTEVIDPLLDTLRDPAPEVRAMAVWALDEFNPSRSHHFDGDHNKYSEHDHDHDDHDH